MVDFSKALNLVFRSFKRVIKVVRYIFCQKMGEKFSEIWEKNDFFGNFSCFIAIKSCNLTLFGGFYVSKVKFYNFWVCPNYSLHQELQLDGATSRFRIDCNLTTFGASSAQMSGRITNLIVSNDFLGPNHPRKLPFPEKYCIFQKSTLSSRILSIHQYWSL